MDEDLEKEKEEENSETEDNQSVKEESKPEDKSGQSATEKNEKVKQILIGKNKEGSFKPIIFVMIASFALYAFWESIPILKNSVHAILGPTAGALLNWDLTWGMMLVIFVIAILTTLVQKYATDQEALRELRKEQKILQEEMKKYRDHPEKIAELSKKQFAFIPKTFKLTSRSIMFTGIPFILFFRWFRDFFEVMGDPKFFSFLSWFWFYLIFTMIFSSILRKVLKVV